MASWGLHVNTDSNITENLERDSRYIKERMILHFALPTLSAHQPFSKYNAAQESIIHTTLKK